MTFPPDSAFAALPRVYGRHACDYLAQMRVCVIGMGGVGSWTVEALARTGVGHLTIIDHDDVTVSNINRQLHALHSTVGESKVELMHQRIMNINANCDVNAIDDFLAETNLSKYLDQEFDIVIDAIDSIRFKAAMINYCKRGDIPVITTGGAGGRTDPLAVGVTDLSRTWNDALAAKVRKRLRSDFGFNKNPKKRFGVDCVFSSEQPVYPDNQGGITHARPGVPGASLDCDQGYGSVSMVTGTFGFVAASQAIKKVLANKEKSENISS